MALNGIAANTMLGGGSGSAARPGHGFYSFMFLGLAPFGSFQAGWIAEHFGVRIALPWVAWCGLLVAVRSGLADGE